MRKYLLLLFTLGLSSGAMGQAIFQGTVLSKNDGLPIVGATVIVNQENKSATSTDLDGKFSLSLSKEKGTITISSIAFKTVEIPYTGNTTLTITMEESLNKLDEIVLIGYGESKKGNIITAIATVNNIETLASRPIVTFTDFLQGNVAGVTVLQQGGDPAENGRILIRGYGSFANEPPLTVVDGIPYYGPPINPNDIESVSILKDAASAAIYGAQASSGVIVIATKRGKIGKPIVSIDAYSGIQRARNLPTPLNATQQASVYNTAADNANVPRQSAHYANLNPWGQTTRTNWVDEIFRDAAIYNVNLNLSGASDRINYMTSFGYNKREGLLIGTESARYSFRVKTDINLTDKITVGENIYYSKTDAIGTNSTSSYSGSIINAVYMPSAAPVRDEQGNFSGVVPENLSSFAGAYGDVYNPVALLLRPTASNPTNFLIGNAYLNYGIIDDLNFKTIYSYSYTNTKSKLFSPRIPEIGRTNLNNFLNQSYSDTQQWVWDNQLAYQKTFGGHNLDATFIYSSQFTNHESYSQQGEGFSSEAPFNQYMSNASVIRTPTTNVYQDALTAAIGRLMYNYDNKYFFSGSVRRDETSRLAKQNQADYFPSASLGWIISKENFFTIPAINNLKLRASWGQIGNINSVGHYSFDVPLNSSDVIIGEHGSLNNKGVYVGRQSNPDLKWETSESLNLGVDVYLFNNKLATTIDYFEKTTKGMIIPGLEDLHQGAAAADVNGGEVQNKGFEFTVNYKDKIGAVDYSINANTSILKNKLANLDGYNKSGIDYIAHTDNVRNTLTPYRSVVGQELYSTYLIPYIGIFQSQAEIDAYTKEGALIQPNAVPGDLKFKDTNNDGKIDNNDREFMDSYLPKFTYNLALQLNYKNFDFNMLFQGVSGVKVFNGYKFTTLNASQSGYNLDNNVLNAWTPENKNSDIPRLSTKDNNKSFGTTSSWYLEDASYVRLKNITFGYSIPSGVIDTILEKSSLRFYLSAENLFTLTKYSGMDPEVGGKGLDVGRYPASMIISTGLSLTF